MLARNAIVRTLREYHSILNHYGEDDIERKITYLNKHHHLDEQKDPPVPEWVLKILKEPKLSFRARIKVVMMHQFDITNVNPSWRFNRLSEVRNAPPYPPTKELVDFRKKMKERTMKYLSKKINEGEK